MTNGTFYQPRNGAVPGATQRLSAAAGPVEVRLRASARVAPYFLCQRYHPSQRIAAELPDGAIEVAYQIDDPATVALWLVLWNLELTLLTPAEPTGQAEALEA